MRTNEERIAAMHQRAGELEREARTRKARIYGAAGLTASLAAVILLAVLIPGLIQSISTDTISNTMMASIFTSSTSLGYIIVAILAFLLGAAVTIFCFRLRKWKDEEREDQP